MTGNDFLSLGVTSILVHMEATKYNKIQSASHGMHFLLLYFSLNGKNFSYCFYIHSLQS